jgi:hypothetical protein
MSTIQERQTWPFDDPPMLGMGEQERDAYMARQLRELLADVDRLTGDNAALSEALDTALAHLKESEADRDKAIAELATVRAIADKTRQAYQAYRDAGASIGGVQFFAFDEWLDWMADAENGPAADACVDNAGYCRP